jgi:MraZ protein
MPSRHRDSLAADCDGRALQRLLLGNATDVDLDSAGRLLVPTELRAGAQLERDLMLLGMGAHFELWDSARLEEHERASLAGGLPESAAQFTF